MNARRKTAVEGRLWLSRERHGFLGQGRMELLRKIGDLGSISRAAQAMGMSYKAAWDAVDSMNNLAERPLVVRERGGPRGGATRLTAVGQELLGVFGTMQEEHERLLQSLNERLAGFARYHTFAKRLGMKTSARNQYWGIVEALRRGAVNSEVTLRLSERDRIVAVITNESVSALGLRKGGEACALIKASSVILAPADPPLRTSARNRLEGTVVRVRPGAVNGTVTLALGEGKTLTAVITTESLRDLNLAPGSRACALVKASHVILAVNE